jgi:2,4-dienoyl-CoA reductase-like NADH-dependent reductase (Old Yellow Enzyme family)
MISGARVMERVSGKSAHTMNQTGPEFQSLRSPMVLAGRTLRNRVVHASMTTRYQSGGQVTQMLIDYGVNRARGGAAAIVSEPLAMLRVQASAPKVRVYEGLNADGLKRWADAVESLDCRLLGQVQDPGRGRHAPGRSPSSIGPSPLPDDMSWTVPQTLSTAQVRALIAEFAESSLHLKRCGFSGVELSCGHGHLFHQFMSPRSNRRDDDYGGDRAGRTRLVAELIAAIREQCGRDFIIGIKLPGDDGLADSIPPDEAAAIADLLTAPRIADYVCFALGGHSHTLEMHLPDRYGPTMPYAELTRRLRAHVNDTPLMALGRITDPAEAEGLLQRGEADLIGLGRALIADPAWYHKAVSGRTHDLRYCVSCNTCWGYGTLHHAGLRCVNNPRVGQSDEADFKPARVDRPRRLVVVGAGVSGLEAAWLAAARGHDVTVFSRSREVGGRTRLRAQLPGGETITSIPDYQYPAALRAGAKFRLGEDATLERILALEPDEVILATGGRMLPPVWLPAEAAQSGLVPDLESALWQVSSMKSRQPGCAVLYDMDHSDGTYAGAERLHELFERVVLITPRDAIATDLWIVARQGIHRRFAIKGIEVVTLVEPVWNDEHFEDGVLEYRNIYSGATGRIEQLSMLTWSTPRAPETDLLGPLQAAGIAVRLVGDARSPRDLLTATTEGHAAGLAV